MNIRHQNNLPLLNKTYKRFQIGKFYRKQLRRFQNCYRVGKHIRSSNSYRASQRIKKINFFSCFERIFYKTSRIQGVECKSQTTQANIEQNTGRNKRSQSVFGNNQVNARCFLYIMKSCTNFKQRSIILYTCVTN